MITRVEIKNYRSIAHADVTMGPLTVLVGRNGSGKSSFVDALKFVRDALNFGLERAIIERNGFASIRSWSPRRKRQVEITIELKRKHFEGRYELVLGSDGDGFKIVREKASFREDRDLLRDSGQTNLDFGFEVNSESIEDSFERNGSNWVSPPSVGNQSDGNQSDPENLTRRMERLGQSLEPTVLALPSVLLYSGFRMLSRELGGDFYTIFPNTLREPQKPTTERVLSDYGDNFVSVLQHVTRNARRKEEIVNVLSRIVHGVCDMRVRAVGSYLVAELQHQDLTADETSNENAPWFDLAQESDGTLRILGLLTALYQPSAPRSSGRELLALEEPEIALHPGALSVLADELKAASRRRQLLITTQSPDLIARFPADDLRVVERRGGVTHIAPLDETQRKVIEDQLFDAGELLRSEGLRGAGGF